MSSLDTEFHLAQTRAFIEANPVTVSIHRSTRTPDGAGGSTLGSLTLVGAIWGRMVGTEVPAADQRTGPEGNQTSLTYAFVMMPGEDIDLGDEFALNGKRYIVEHVSVSPPWRLTASLMEQS